MQTFLLTAQIFLGAVKNFRAYVGGLVQGFRPKAEIGTKRAHMALQSVMSSPQLPGNLSRDPLIRICLPLSRNKMSLFIVSEFIPKL